MTLLQRAAALQPLPYSARFAVGLLVVLLVLPSGVPEAHASCGVGPTPNDGLTELERIAVTAPVAFVGTVIATDSRDRRALVSVESVWRGPDLPATVIVQGSVLSPSAASSEDRRFMVGQRYLFVPTNTASPFQDNSCTATRLYADTFVPATARPPRLPGGVTLPTAEAQAARRATAVGAAPQRQRSTPATSWMVATVALVAVVLLGGSTAVFAGVRRARRRGP